MKSKWSLLLVLAAVLLFTSSANAVLFRVGPADVPSPPGNGFPFWYQDTNGLAMDLCLPANQAQLDAGVCLILPTAQDPVAGIDLPIVFPTNYPDEAFYWNATLADVMPAGGRVTLVLGLEATFGGGVPAANDQIVFGRVRIRVDIAAPGNYTVTYPFGVLNFPDVPAGTKTINFTSDIGLTVGNFAEALQSDIGPFLLASNAPGGAPLPFVTVPGDASGDEFISDAATLVSLTGSPTGNNFLEICTDNPNGVDNAGGPLCVTFTQFTLMGKVHQGAIGSPLAVDRATYDRSDAGASVDAFATATPGPGAATPILTLADSVGTAMPSVLMNGPTTLGQFYGQGLPAVADALPTSVVVTNIADSPPTSVVRAVVDQVTVSQASYDPNTGILTIVATSSDKGLTGPPALAPPQLFAIGLPGSVTGSDALATTNSLADPAEQSLAYVIPPVAGGPVPPPTVIVTSSVGGQESQAVSPVAGAAFAAGGPVAVDDGLNLLPGASAVVDVLANDVGVGPAAAVSIVSSPANGVLTPGPAANLFFYTANGGFTGDDTFTYYFANGALPLDKSNVATVTISVQGAPGANNPPVAAPDTFSTAPDTPLSIPPGQLLANDSDPDPGTVLRIVAVSPTSTQGGTVTRVGAPVIYTPPAAFTGTDTFTYTISDGSLTAVGTVTVNVIGEQITVARAVFRQGGARWRVDGTTTVVAPNNITVTLSRTGQTIGVAAVDAVGAWAVDIRNSTIIPQAGDRVTVTSTSGASVVAIVAIRP